MAHTLPAKILATIDEQSVTIPATDQYGRVIRGLARVNQGRLELEHARLAQPMRLECRPLRLPFCLSWRCT